MSEFYLHTFPLQTQMAEMGAKGKTKIKWRGHILHSSCGFVTG